MDNVFNDIYIPKMYMLFQCLGGCDGRTYVKVLSISCSSPVYLYYAYIRSYCFITECLHQKR